MEASAMTWEYRDMGEHDFLTLRVALLGVVEHVAKEAEAP